MGKKKQLDDFLKTVKNIADYWSDIEGVPVEQKCDGVAFTILSLLDGETVAIPKLDLVSYDEETLEGEVINEGVMLHEKYTNEQYMESLEMLARKTDDVLLWKIKNNNNDGHRFMVTPDKKEMTEFVENKLDEEEYIDICHTLGGHLEANVDIYV